METSTALPLFCVFCFVLVWFFLMIVVFFQFFKILFLIGVSSA